MSTSKYTTLAQFLQKQVKPEVRLPFAGIEQVLGFPLPPSARKHRPWWANDPTHAHAESGWMRVGWRVARVEMDQELVQFQRVPHSESRPSSSAPCESVPVEGVGRARMFQEFARKALASHFGEDLRPGQLPGIPKLFDFVSPDQQTVGDAKYYSLVRGEGIPPAKFSAIAEHVWLLERTGARRQFLVFGNDRRVPEGWLHRYGKLVTDVELYFLDDQGRLTELH